MSYGKIVFNKKVYNSPYTISVVDLLNFEESLVAYLIAHTGYPVYANKIPQRGVKPCIVYQIISRPHEHVLSGSAGVASATVQIDCWATTHSVCRTIKESVRNCLQGFTGHLTADGVLVLCSIPTTQRKQFTPSADGTGTGSHRYLLEYEIDYEVDLPSITYDGSVADGTQLEEALSAYLAGVTSVSLYPDYRPQTSSMPCVVWVIESINYMHDLSGSSGVADYSVSLTSYASTYSAAVDLDETMRLALDGYAGTMGGCDVLSIILEDDEGRLDQPNSGADQGIHSTRTRYVATVRHELPDDIAG